MALKARLIGREQAVKMLNLVAPNIGAALAGMQMKVARDLADTIKKYAPVRDGAYRDSIHADRLANRPDAKLVGNFNKTTDPNATGVFAAWYWHFLEFGTRPHTIKAKNAPFMVFEGREGTLKYMRVVNHPGSPPQPHIFPIYRAEKKNIRRRLARVVNRAVKKAIDNQKATSADGEVS